MNGRDMEAMRLRTKATKRMMEPGMQNRRAIMILFLPVNREDQQQTSRIGFGLDVKSLQHAEAEGGGRERRSARKSQRVAFFI
jgi:hypothetical protein